MLASYWISARGVTMETNAIRSERLSVLVVDDEKENLDLLRRVLHRQYDVFAADSGEEGLEVLRSNPQVAVVVTDQRMPGLSGVELLCEAVQVVPKAVRIIVSAFTETEDILEAINLGRVDRFVVKPIQSDRLANTVKDALEVYYLSRELEEKNRRLQEHQHELEEKNQRLKTNERELEDIVAKRTAELEAANARLVELALRDGLTGLYNHRYFHERLQAEVSRARRHGHEIGLLFIDIDHFKNYNDTHGHPEGDNVLREIGKLLLEGACHEDVVARVRSSDVVARYGGEEFAIILPQTPKQGAEVTAERIRRCIAAHTFAGGDTQPLGGITVSIGVAAFPACAPDAGELIRAADRAMYDAKHQGRNHVCVAPNVCSFRVEST